MTLDTSHRAMEQSHFCNSVVHLPMALLISTLDRGANATEEDRVIRIVHVRVLEFGIIFVRIVINL